MHKHVATLHAVITDQRLLVEAMHQGDVGDLSDSESSQEDDEAHVQVAQNALGEGPP